MSANPSVIADLRLDRVLRRMLTAWTGRWLAARANEHLAAGVPPLAVFAFDHVGRSVVQWGRYEREELELLMSALKPMLPPADDTQPEGLRAGVALDIGANCGNHAVFFAEHFSEVLAFEPHPHTHALLQVNARLRPNLRCFNLGLSDEAREATLRVPALNVGMASLQPSAPGEAVACRLQRLDALPDVNNRRVALMKLDVEGHEAAVLRGARALLARDQPVVLLEQAASEFRDGSTEALDLLREAGYTRWWVMDAYPAGHPHGGPRAWVLLRRALFGEGLRLSACLQPEPRFHTMIVALPPGLGGPTNKAR